MLMILAYCLYLKLASWVYVKRLNVSDFLFYRWLSAPTEVNAYYAPEYNQFGMMAVFNYRLYVLRIYSISCWYSEVSIHCG